MTGFSRRLGGGTPSKTSLGGQVGEYPQVNKTEIDSFIAQFSVAIRYWKAIQCPCFQERTGQPSISCNQCRGLGWFHTNFEKEAIYQRGMVHSRSSSEKDGKGGRHISGYASITFLPGIIPGDGDLVQICQDREVVNNETHTVGHKLSDGSTGESLRFRDVVCIEKVLRHDADHNVVDLARDLWTYNEAERMIEFPDARVGDKYSVRYVATPEYILRADTAKPLLRVAHNDALPEPMRTSQDQVFAMNCRAVRLDRAILQRQRGEVDYTTQSTFNSSKNKGPFR